MILVRQEEAEVKQVLTPWIRVVRQEARRGETHPSDYATIYGLDVVHRAHLDTYLEQSLRPFFDLFVSRATRHDQVLASGKGFAPNMARDPTNIEAGLRPRA
jgi:hypothetical protein